MIDLFYRILFGGWAPQLGTLADWIVGLATFGAFAVAATTIIQQKQQLLRNAKYEQAEQVSAWIALDRYNHTRIMVSNKSNGPVYGVVISLVAFYGAAPQDGKALTQTIGPEEMDKYRICVSVLPSLKDGTYKLAFEGVYSGMHLHPGVEIAFTDRSNNSWIRDARGRLYEINQTPERYYDIPEPITWKFVQD